MDLFEKELFKKQQELIQLAAHLKKEPSNSIRLCVKTNIKPPQFFVRGGQFGKNGKYLSDPEKIRQYAQQEYNRLFARKIRKWSKSLEVVARNYPNNRPEDILRQMHACKRPYITPFVPDKDAYAEAWQKAKFEGNPYPIEKPLTTKRGDIVRSKSELYIADSLFDAGILYRYEAPLYISHETFYPDFTILIKHTCELIYWEHQGMMEDPVYCQKALRKQALYSANNICSGKNLIITQESENVPLPAEAVRAIIGYLKEKND